MPFDEPSLEETTRFLRTLGKSLFPDLNFGSDSSYHGKMAEFDAAAATQIHLNADSVQRDLHPLTAGDGKPINDWGQATGVERKGATPARKSAAGRIRGAAGAGPILPGTQLKHASSGLIFKISNSAPLTIPGVVGVDPDSFVDADIAGVDVGSQTRLKAGETLTFITPIPFIQANVKLQLALDQDGTDNEQFGSYRGRFLGSLGQAKSGGNKTDFVSWIEASLPSIAKGYSLGGRAGRGTVDLVGFYAAQGTSRSLSAPDRDAVLLYVKARAPIQVSGDDGPLRTLVTIADPQRVEIRVSTNGIAAFAFDWSDAVVPTVLAYTPATRTVQFAGGTLPASMRSGHRIVPVGVPGGSGASAQDGREYVIEAITGADTFVIDDDPPTPPAATDLVYSGGPLVTPIRDAIVGHLNGETVYAGRGLVPIPASATAPTNPGGQQLLGLDELAEGLGPANPGRKYGPWPSGISLATLYKIATYKAGVANISIVVPVADYEPLDDAFPNDAQIHYVTPGVVIIRSA